MSTTMLQRNNNISTYEIESFQRYASLETYRDGSVLFGTGDAPKYVYLIEEGHLKICQYSENGAPVAILLHGPGDIVGAGAVLEDHKRAVFAVTVGKPCRFWKLSAASFMRLMEKNTAFSINIARNFAVRLRNADQQILRHTLIGGRQRLCLVLYEKALHAQKDDNLPVRIKTTHQELSEMTATCRQTTTEMLGQLKKEGILLTRKGGIDIVDMSALQKEAIGDEDAEVFR